MVIPPSICDLCEMDWANGACGDCTMTRKQLEYVANLDRQIREIKKYFISGNSVPVERATILAQDFWQIIGQQPSQPTSKT